MKAFEFLEKYLAVPLLTSSWNFDKGIELGKEYYLWNVDIVT